MTSSQMPRPSRRTLVDVLAWRPPVPTTRKSLSFSCPSKVTGTRRSALLVDGTQPPEMYIQFQQERECSFS
jgi:hypothetical protein